MAGFLLRIELVVVFREVEFIVRGAEIVGFKDTDCAFDRHVSAGLKVSVGTGLLSGH